METLATEHVGGADDPSAVVGFYTAADSRHFLGAVGLVNSLRQTGHTGPVSIVDLGLEDLQRELLLPHVRLVVPQRPVAGYLAKPIGPLEHSAEVVVILDADVVVVRSLDPLIEVARGRKLVFFENDDTSRFFEEWEGLGLGPLQRAPYVTSGHIIGHWELARPLLERMWELQASIDVDRTLIGGADPASPYYFVDMDVLNALLMTVVDPSDVVRLDNRLAPIPPFRDLGRGTALDSHANASAPYLLHHVLGKPWLTATTKNAYCDALSASLWCKDGPIHVPRAMVPLRLRGGRLASVDWARAGAVSRMNQLVRGRLGVRPRLARLRARPK